MFKRTVSIFLCAAVFLGLLLVPVSASAARYAGAVTTRSGSLNVRKSASSGSQVLAELPKGSHITLISKAGAWWYVEYGKNSYGYCHGDYITPIAGTAATVQAAALNVRSGPGSSYAVKGWLTKGEAVVVLSTSNGWSRILYHGTKTGYVSAKYLSAGSTEVLLNVPSFKQTDSRWANVKIGSSGKTIAQIGCATTAIAMMESYRTGTTVYPDAMAKKLTYTASGSVYWPSHYTVTTSSADYLSRILSLLQSGKPVLFGAKNRYGGQHWVVITGFTGGELTAANFTIHDPGSNSRTTLQQFLNVYPVFYKYFHY